MFRYYKLKSYFCSVDSKRTVMTKVKQLPYGVADFETVMKDNLYYVDKTMYIPLLEEQPRNLMFIRPRRFGQSLLLSML